MNIKTKLLEEYVNFVDTIAKHVTYFKITLVLIVIIVTFFSFYLLFEYLNE